MNHSTRRGGIDRAVKRLPALATQASNPTLSGSDCKRDQQDKSKKSNGDESPLLDIFPHTGEDEGLIRANVSEEMQADIEESEEAEHAAKTDEVGEIQELSQRSDGQGEDEKVQRPISGFVLIELDGIGSEPSLQGAKADVEKRGQANDKDKHLGPLAGEKFVQRKARSSGISSDPCQCTSWLPDRRSH